MFSDAKIIKKYCINSNNPTILYKVVGLLYKIVSVALLFIHYRPNSAS